MDKIAQKSEPNNRNNEDFVFTAQLSSAQLLVVGDFAQTEYLGVDATTTSALQTLMQDSSIIEAARSSAQLLLTQLASKFNGRLLVFTETYQARFQSSVVFAVVQDAMLYYLPIGDCRLAIRRRESLILLNGSVWLDSFGHPLTIVVNSTQEMIRGPEPPPDQALGVTAQMSFQPAQVQDFSLERDDLVLLYSDGLDKFVSPARIIGLIEKYAASDSTQALTERILNEARIQHGDDDRTLLMMVGPHLKAEDARVAESRHEVKEIRDKFNQFVGDMATRVTSVETNIGELKRLQTAVEALNKPIIEIARRVAQIPTADELKASPAQSLNAERLVKIEDSLNKLAKKIKPGRDRSGDLDGTGGSATGQETTTSVHPATVPVSPDPQPLTIREINFELPFREGLIYVEQGFYELVDVTHRSRLPTGRETYFGPPQTAPAGWLTAFCLYLRLRQEQPLETDNAASVKAWLLGHQKRGSEVIAAVPLPELRNSRELHWSIRDHRARSLFSLSRKRLIEEETRLADRMFKVLGERSRPVPTVHKEPSTGWLKFRDFLKTPSGVLALIGILGIFIVLAWFIIPSLVSSKPTTRETTITPSTTEPVRLEYGADGRTLLVASRGGSKLLEYRITYGKEKEFRDVFTQSQFSSIEELTDKIESDAATLVSRADQPDIMPNKLAMMAVDPLDVNDASPTTPEKCERFLARVNKKKLPPGVHNELTDLVRLNPGLRCGNLKPGDLLVVIAKPG